MEEVYIISAVRTPIGSFGGKLASLSATKLGSAAVAAAIERAGIDPSTVQELLMGNVIASGLGQAPATQVAVGAGLGYTVPASLINKVCASGMKAVMFGAQTIQLDQANTIVTGGMESMSNIPYYLTRARTGYRYGHGELLDGLQYDGLTDAYYQCAMGMCADNTAKEMNISREEQDKFAITSYKRSAEAWSAGRFTDEVIPIEITDKKGNTSTVTQDEEFTKVNLDKIPSLKPAFSQTGTVTAANASTLNDGAAALVLMSKSEANKKNLRPIGRVLGFADASQDPMWFTTTPSLAIPKAIKQAGLTDKDIDYYEINEAFSAVVLANAMKLNLNPERINVNGGGVSLGHPLGASGARIIVTLLNVLKQRNAQIGVAGICNGGGGASAVVIERL